MNEQPKKTRRLPWPLVVIGGGALLLAAGVDTIAVIGRHVGLPFLGSIELIKAAILVASAMAIVAATLAGSHAVVRLVRDRLPPRGAALLGVVYRLISAVFFLALVAGSIWLTADLWHGFEESEFLHLPYKPLRIFTSVSLLAIALLFLRQAIRGDGE